MRKHLYLVVEHENPDRVGGVKIIGKRMSQPVKNERGPIQKIDKESGTFDTVGTMVGMGYADFDDEDDYEERIGDVIHEKLAEIDREHVEAAGLEPEEVLA